ncbi:hypothetical protein Mp_6g02780 [Marchantia polymorpha subsp. ruderalis]|uniref:Uncharacterized protein n=2 Tax=Marchantia polymorpha TaxID=3197 RepID=A0AAF6BMW3_MARPO|nr:hypothetical protein MARPO_0035s0065 [Marchantia polymorpha]BBN13347.1 hypothetical protein Mp_6g02780 [Marchantia polymorpha subsp. ruderalis]|eukprot:PTQ41275.1 hypothetical protein MARPO_0035s0065 [Marchantia polymorpha]
MSSHANPMVEKLIPEWSWQRKSVEQIFHTRSQYHSMRICRLSIEQEYMGADDVRVALLTSRLGSIHLSSGAFGNIDKQNAGDCSEREASNLQTTRSKCAHVRA